MGFDFTIAITPKITNIDQELQYVKSALLYADNILLISPLAYMYTQLSLNKPMANETDIIRIIKACIPMVEENNPDSAPKMKKTIEDFSNLFHSRRYKSVPMLQKIEIRRGLSEIAKQIDELLIGMIGEKQAAELNTLIDSKRLTLQRFEHNLMDVDGGVEEFFHHLKSTIKNSYPLFDKESNDLMVAALKSHVISLSESDKKKITHAGMSDNLIQRLPSFETAGVDEILDIRKELNPSLARYRAEMLSYSEEIQIMPWDDDFEYACTELYYKKVVPAITEIDELTKENTFIKNLGFSALTSGDVLRTLGGLVISIAAGGVIGAYNDVVSTDTAVLVSGGTWAVSKVAAAFRENREKMREIQKKELYFYYKAGQMLSK